MRHPHFDPAEHPRGPNGRFTESFTNPLTGADRAKAARIGRQHRPRKDLTSPDTAGAYLQGLSGDKPDPSPSTFMAGGFKDVNGGLRAGNADSPGVAALDKAMRPVPDDLTVWRHIPTSMFGNVDPKSLVGMHVHDAGFFATTLAPPKRDAGGVRMQILVPSGTKAAPASDVYGLVLDRGLDMAVTAAADGPDGGLDMTVTVLSDTTPGAPAQAPTEPSAPADTPAEPPDEQPALEPEPRTFDQRRDNAASGNEALQQAPVSYYTERGWEEAGLTDAHMDALDRYIQNNDWAINNQLRTGGDDEQIQGWIDRIDAVMEQSQLGSDVEAWRGLRDGSLLFGDRLNGDLTGMEWREDAYVSTSADQNVSEQFATGAAVRDREAPNPVLMHLVVPQGVGAVEMSDERYEAELLLQRGLTLRIVADHGVGPNGVRRIDVEVVPVAT